ncbi:RNA polymerase II subunit A C-terminal domain phosphatase [Microdochium nivale]|nr:RNA polymerase II subunit A C-terminal domain phosphatase [Microdochium nivale]
MAPKKSTEKPIFQGCVIALASDLGKPDWTDDQIDRWVSIRRGKYVRSLDSLLPLTTGSSSSGGDNDDGDGAVNITHVLATEDMFKGMSAKRKTTLRDEGVHVVLFDWLEDSIYAKRRLAEGKFDLLKRHREEVAREAARLKKLDKVARGIEEAKKGVNTNLNHVYMDSTCFSYDIVMTRMDAETNMVGEKWRLRLWESNGSPYLYLCTATFNKRGGKTSVIRPSKMETPGPLDRELAAWKKFFKIKTGIAWSDRVSRIEENRGEAGNFQYEPPVGGKPLGVFEDEPDDDTLENGHGPRRKRKLHVEDAGKEDYDEVQRRKAKSRLKEEDDSKEAGLAKLDSNLLAALKRLHQRPQLLAATNTTDDGDDGELDSDSGGPEASEEGEDCEAAGNAASGENEDIDQPVTHRNNNADEGKEGLVYSDRPTMSQKTPRPSNYGMIQAAEAESETETGDISRQGDEF